MFFFRSLGPLGPISGNSWRLWPFRGSVQEFCRKVPGKLRENSGKIAGKFFPNREMLQILGFRAPGKANLPETLGPHCRDLVPTFRAWCFLKSTVPTFSSFSDYNTPTPRCTRRAKSCHLAFIIIYSKALLEVRMRITPLLQSNTSAKSSREQPCPSFPCFSFGEKKKARKTTPKRQGFFMYNEPWRARI